MYANYIAGKIFKAEKIYNQLNRLKNALGIIDN